VDTSRIPSSASVGAPMLFRPFSQEYSPKMNLVLRETRVDGVGPSVALRELDESWRVVRSGRLGDFVADSMVLERIGIAVASAGTVFSLLISLGSIYVLLVDVVTARRREIGLRLALGAPGFSVFAGVALIAARVAGSGIIAGMVAGVL